MFYYSGILHPVFITDTIMYALRLYGIVPPWSSSYKELLLRFVQKLVPILFK